MSKSIYCIGKIKGNQTTIGVTVNEHENSSHAKRVDIVSIKMVKESSILYKNRKISSPVDVYNLLKSFLENSDREKLIVCCFDVKNQPTVITVVSVGTLNSSLIHPREIFKTAILSNAASIIIAHNHPSGDTSPSSEDINTTQRLKECGKLLGIDLLDHLIVGDGTYTSLKEKGIFN